MNSSKFLTSYISSICNFWNDILECVKQLMLYTNYRRLYNHELRIAFIMKEK